MERGSNRINSLAVSEPRERACCDRSDLVAPEKNFTFASNRISRSLAANKGTSEQSPIILRSGDGERAHV